MAQSVMMPPSSGGERCKISYEEFLEDYDSRHAEWVDGEVIEMPPMDVEHSREGVWLSRLMGNFVEAKALGEIHVEPFQMKPSPGLPGRSPDILFVANANLHRIRRTYLEGPADVVVEIISLGTASIDRGAKFIEYEQGGVGEYWMIDPIRQIAEFYRLDQDGLFRSVQLDGDIFRSEALPGFWLKVEWLWPGTQPPVLQVLREWKII